MTGRQIVLLGIAVFVATVLANLIAAALVANEARNRLAERSTQSQLFEAVLEAVR
jgi:hypothetical protein